jgi:uncharacterized coiled-coil DUF342 family protein
MKKAITIILTVIIVLCLFSACISTEERALEQAKKAAAELSVAASKATERNDRMHELLDQYDEMQEKISRLKKDIPEYRAAVNENNRIVRQLIAEFPEFEQALK